MRTKRVEKDCKIPSSIPREPCKETERVLNGAEDVE